LVSISERLEQAGDAYPFMEVKCCHPENSGMGSANSSASLTLPLTNVLPFLLLLPPVANRGNENREGESDKRQMATFKIPS
jgi:hypothetical protein